MADILLKLMLADLESGDILNKGAERMFQSLVSALSEQENVTEKLKATAPMEWVQKMNNIRNRAAEIVNSELIFV